MLHTIESHEFLEQDGELVLITDRLSDANGIDPIFLISAIDNSGYLRRGPGEVYALRGLDHAIVERLRLAKFLIVIEMDGGRVAHSYDAPAGPLEYDEDAWAVTKALTVIWCHVARYWVSTLRSL
jgi:hypothetical protein